MVVGTLIIYLLKAIKRDAVFVVYKMSEICGNTTRCSNKTITASSDLMPSEEKSFVLLACLLPTTGKAVYMHRSMDAIISALYIEWGTRAYQVGSC